MLFLLGAIPLIIITVCNVAILIKLAQRQRQRAQLGVNTNNINDTQDTRTNAMLISIMLAYILLNFPTQAYVVYLVASGNMHNVNGSVLRVLVFLTTLGISINFVLYGFTSSQFRDAVVDLFQSNSNVTSQAGGVPAQRGRISNVRARLAADQSGGSREIQVPLKRIR